MVEEAQNYVKGLLVKTSGNPHPPTINIDTCPEGISLLEVFYDSLSKGKEALSEEIRREQVELSQNSTPNSAFIREKFYYINSVFGRIIMVCVWGVFIGV